MAVVGIVVNPNAGKDIRRLVSPATHVSDVTKVGIVRRAVVAAAESGASRILLAPDRHRLAERAAAGLNLPIEIVDEPVTGTRHDTIGAARRFWKEGAGAVIALGGDGTSRDVAFGWPDAPLIPISTGTNNVFPFTVDGTSAGVAAGLVASGAIAPDDVVRRAKRVTVGVVDGEVGDHGTHDDVAVVELALVDTRFVGARAVRDAASIRAVVAAVATPASTGLSSIAGRVHPVDRWEPGGVLVRLGRGGRRVRVPLAPGDFTTLEVAEVRPLAEGELVEFEGPGVLAFDGERDLPLSSSARVTASVDRSGPLLIDVERVLVLAAREMMFDRPEDRDGH